MAATTGAGKLLASSTLLVVSFPSSFLLFFALKRKRVLENSIAILKTRLLLRLRLNQFLKLRITMLTSEYEKF